MAHILHYIIVTLGDSGPKSTWKLYLFLETTDKPSFQYWHFSASKKAFKYHQAASYLYNKK